MQARRRHRQKHHDKPDDNRPQNPGKICPAKLKYRPEQAEHEQVRKETRADLNEECRLRRRTEQNLQDFNQLCVQRTHRLSLGYYPVPNLPV